MSMNIHLRSVANAKIVDKNGKEIEKRIICEEFDCIQTPTDVTKSILNSEDPAQTYIDWLDSKSFSKKHTRELKNFLKSNKNWEIQWYEL